MTTTDLTRLEQQAQAAEARAAKARADAEQAAAAEAERREARQAERDRVCLDTLDEDEAELREAGVKASHDLEAAVRADPVAQAWARHLASRLRLVNRHNEAVNAASRLGRQSTGAYMNGFGDPEFLHVAQIISREAEYIVSDEVAVREAELDGEAANDGT